MSQKIPENSLRDINQPLYRYWEALYLSFYSPEIYRDARLRWKGINAFYLLLVIMIFSLPLGLKVTHSMTSYFDNQLLLPLTKLPQIYIQNGNVSIDEPMPYFVKNDKGEVQAVVDTTGHIDGFGPKYPKMTILITKDAIYYRQLTPSSFIGLTNQETPAPKIVKQPFNKSETQVLNMKKVIDESGIKKIKWAIQVLIYPILVMSIYSAYLILMLSFALLGQVLARVFFTISLKYKESCRLSALAFTPHLGFSLLLAAFDFYIPAYGFLAMTILIAYYGFGLVCVRRDMKQMVYR